uniref:Uncharacterized protein n=1 Tax=Opuntia streptacantha TaxID=393608 RepID=A0A7C9CBI4_OPUST
MLAGQIEPTPVARQKFKWFNTYLLSSDKNGASRVSCFPARSSMLNLTRPKDLGIRTESLLSAAWSWKSSPSKPKLTGIGAVSWFWNRYEPFRLGRWPRKEAVWPMKRSLLRLIDETLVLKYEEWIRGKVGVDPILM